VIMSDYSDYSDGDDYDNSDQENYAGAYGGYDDLYDDVMEEAGYDAWGIFDDEFGFDEESFLFEFDPFLEYFELKDDCDVVTMTYQSLLQLAKMTSLLLSAWQKRSIAVEESNLEEARPEDDQPFQSIPGDWFGLNLYHLESKEREELRAYSVDKVKRLFGGEEEIVKCKEELANIVKILKKCLLDVLGHCFPLPLPYPVLSSILSHLLAVQGLDKLGMVNKEQEDKDMEMVCMDKLYLSLADVYDHLKVVMFNIEPNTHSTDPSFSEKKTNLSDRFKQLVDVVNTNSVGLEDGLGALDMSILGRIVSGESTEKEDDKVSVEKVDKDR